MGNELGESDEEEVEVEEELELFVEDYGEEGEDVVLLVPYDVGGEFVLDFFCAWFVCLFSREVDDIPGGLKGILRDLSCPLERFLPAFESTLRYDLCHPSAIQHSPQKYTH